MTMLTLALFALLAPQSQDGPRVPGSHKRMVEILNDISDRVPEENPWLGDKVVRDLREQAVRLGETAPLPLRWRLFRNLGNGELRIGNYREAVDSLTKAWELRTRLQGQVPQQELQGTLFDLGVAYLRWGETENCVEQHCCSSCILPFGAEAIHTKPEGSEGAMRCFSELLDLSPGDVSALWLLNIAAMTLGRWPDGLPPKRRIPPQVFATEAPFFALTDVAPDLGLNTHDLSGGAVIDDFDNDGDLDLVTSTFDSQGPMHFFRAQGDGTFVDESERSRLGQLKGGLNMVQADYDNDGLVDLYVLRGAWLELRGRHPNSLIRNQGDGYFADMTLKAGMASPRYPTQTAAWGDYDLDGDLDLYVGNENFEGQGHPNQLYRNNDDGTFTDVAAEAGVLDHRYTKGTSWGDIDNDGDPDLYVSNLRGPNRLYLNNGDGTFTDHAEERGVQVPMLSFPTWFWDFNNDGNLDLYVSTYWSSVRYVASSYLGIRTDGEEPRLYQGDGKGWFKNVNQDQNLRRLTNPMGANFGDLDGDGYLDFYLGTGYPGYEGLMPNVLYHNLQGKGFADVTTAAGVGHVQKGHGVAFADLDADGDLDLFAQMGGAYPGDAYTNVLFQNPGNGNHALTVKVVGVTSNRSGIGTRLKATFQEDGQIREVHRTVNSGGSFGCNPLRQTIGLGTATKVDTLEVTWPASRTTQVFTDLEAGTLVVVTEGSAEPGIQELR